MQYFELVISWNPIITIAVCSWVSAQVLKTLINAALMGKITIERLFGDGGMPSAHSATVCSMAIATARYAGTASPVFAVAAILACITMHDAMGVRRETGEQAKILNRLINDWIDHGAQNNPFLADKKLKEMVGHTPIEVISGAILGILIGSFFPLL